MLEQVPSPELHGVKLTETDSDVIITKKGIEITNFTGDDGNEYERVEYPNGIVIWLKV